MTEQDRIGVLFVCLGNICRSPSAQGIFQQKVDQAGLTDRFLVDSCGTAPFNVGKSPDPRALQATKDYGYDISAQIARQICEDDYRQFHYIIPMDRKNMMSLTAWQPSDFQGEIKLFMHYHENHRGSTQIPDPYREGVEKFYPIIEIIEEASHGLLKHIIDTHSL